MSFGEVERVRRRLLGLRARTRCTWHADALAASHPWGSRMALRSLHLLKP